MRPTLLISAAVLLAACADNSHITGNGDALPTVDNPAATYAGPMPAPDDLAIAAKDAIERLMPGLLPDAAGTVREAIESVATTLNDADNSRTLLASYRRLGATLELFRDQSRSDATTLDNIAIEFGIAR